MATRGKIRRMGYEIHITRAEEWFDNEESQIPRAEWLAVGDSWFDWFEGNLDTKNPDHATLAKALALAGVLAARVQGDDGERYESPDDFFRPPERGR